MGQAQIKDGTAQGVAKIRHYEALHEPSKRLYHDQYAQNMYPGSFVQTWLGEGATRRLYDAFGLKGLLEMITTRTKWLDDEVIKAVSTDSGVDQLVILGAGYDTRGFRLDLPTDLSVFEVDQPDVQAKKIQIVERLSKSDADIASRMGTLVKFVPVNFNSDSIDEKLTNTEGYSVDKLAVITLEGVTQYIPKASTADTLTKLKQVVAPGSKLLISYVHQNVFDDPSKCGPPNVVKRIMDMVGKSGEPWISAWTCDGFKTFLNDLGYQVISDTTACDYNDEYLVPLDRGLKEEEMLSMERYVIAIIK